MDKWTVRFGQALATCLKAKMPMTEAIYLARQIADRDTKK